MRPASNKHNLKNLCIVQITCQAIIHILRVPLTSSYHQHLSNNNQPHRNLLKTTKATVCKATDCISRGMVWLGFWLVPWVLQPSLLYSFNARFSYISCNSPRQPVHIQNISVFMQAVVQVVERSHKETSVNKMSSYNLWYFMNCNMTGLRCLRLVAKLNAFPLTFIVQIT